MKIKIYIWFNPINRLKKQTEKSTDKKVERVTDMHTEKKANRLMIDNQTVNGLTDIQTNK